MRVWSVDMARVRISGKRRLPYPQDIVWEALLDPELLATAMPGCERLTPTSEHRYEAEVNLELSALKGRYRGAVEISEIEPPDGYRVTVSGGGQPGGGKAQGRLRLVSQNGATEVTYDGSADLFGPAAAVGQRFMAAAARKVIGQFFNQFEIELERRAARSR